MIAVERPEVRDGGLVPAELPRVRSRDAAALSEAMRAIPPEWFRAVPSVYWTDLVASAAIGWTAFVAAIRSPMPVRAALLSVAIVALYRAVLFIHEITHRAARDVPWFRFAWNTVVGVPLLLPSFLYEGVHNEHHRQHSYGTHADPEYVPYAHRRPWFIAGSVVAAAAAPLVFIVRFAILAPVAWLVPSVRRAVDARFSALVINPQYVRRDPLPAHAYVQEVAACLFAWTAVGLWLAGLLPTVAIGCWVCAAAAASLVNAIRTLAAHRYDNDDGTLGMVEQLLDSCTIAARPTAISVAVEVGHAVVAPLGLRYHSLHHWMPALPYHRLGAVHRRLIATLSPDAPYRSTISAGFVPVIRQLFQRARSRR